MRPAGSISREKYESVYHLGRQVFAKEIGISEARNKLQKVGLNPNSAADLVYNLGRLLSGKRYTRAMSIPVTHDYLTWIRRDYGEEALVKAISALRQHIEYYETIRNVRMNGLRNVLSDHTVLTNSDNDFFQLPDEPEEVDSLKEGLCKAVFVNVYERNPKARKLCIKKFGAICRVCNFDFGRTYGPIGEGFIHVHHLRELAEIRDEYEVDPENDLCPVCPNCHAMLHKSKPAYSIEELQDILNRQKNRNR